MSKARDLTSYMGSLSNEVRIVWLEDPENFDYVRQGRLLCWQRKGRPGRHRVSGRLVGYAELSPSTKGHPPGAFYRRLFWVMPHDRSEDPNEVYSCGNTPTEAVDPTTVAPGVAGFLTERAWGRPFNDNE